MSVKPCPFCGSIPEVRKADYHDDGKSVWLVRCLNEDCGGWWGFQRRNKLTAIKAWNTRTP